jgi:hypothetical protein
MTGRSYPPAVEKALFLLSRGRCYEPTCQQPVMRIIKGEPFVNVQIAHICAHDDNGPRCAIEMTKAERRSFKNLLLLCKPHHTLIDRKINESEYSEAVLRGWKHLREGDFSSQLSGLENLTEDKLQQILAEAVGSANDTLTAAIDEMATISSDSADILRRLKIETFEQPYLDIDAVASLAHSAEIIRHLEDYAGVLHEATADLANFEDNVNTLWSAADMLKHLEDKTVSLESVAKRLDSSAVEINRLPWDAFTADIDPMPLARSRPISNQARTGTRSTVRYPSRAQTDQAARWLYFKWGLGVGAFVIIAILVLVLVVMHHQSH